MVRRRTGDLVPAVGGDRTESFKKSPTEGHCPGRTNLFSEVPDLRLWRRWTWRFFFLRASNVHTTVGVYLYCKPDSSSVPKEWCRQRPTMSEHTTRQRRFHRTFSGLKSEWPTRNSSNFFSPMIGLSLSLSLRHSITISVRRNVSRHAHARAPTPNTLHSVVEGATVPTDYVPVRWSHCASRRYWNPASRASHTVGKHNILVAFFLPCPNNCDAHQPA